MYKQGGDIQHYFFSLIAKACNIPMETIDKNAPILELGIDSMIAAKINMQVYERLGIELPFDQIANNASIHDIIQYLSHQLEAPETVEESVAQNSVSLSTEPVTFEVFDDVAYFEKINALNSSAYDITRLSQYKKLSLRKNLFKKAQVEIPYFKGFNSPSTDTMLFEERQLINFASYNYLGYNNDPRINAAAQQAIKHYGTSAASSRIVSGEKYIHKELESAIASLYQVEDALVFVSGYATNVGVISHLMEKNDLIIHDSLAHNSIVMGSQFSSAKRLKFLHNDLIALENILKENRLLYERVLIVIEGLYSMDGDIPDLAAIVALKKQYKCLLMVDEAHSMGVLGEHGFGIREHCQVASTDVDIWMGTLSKSFAGCGGYIAGSAQLIDYLKYTAPSFIFSVGLAPPLAGASLAAIELLKTEKHRVKKLQDNSHYFLSKAKQKGFNTGASQGYAIIPIIFGDSLYTAKLANYLFSQGINVQSIIYPGVEESSARLRFFISALHTMAHMEHSLDVLGNYCFESRAV